MESCLVHIDDLLSFLDQICNFQRHLLLLLNKIFLLLLFPEVVELRFPESNFVLLVEVSQTPL